MMAYAWARRIVADAPEVTIDNVPKFRRAAVLAILAKEGLDGYGQPLESQGE